MLGALGNEQHNVQAFDFEELTFELPLGYFGYNSHITKYRTIFIYIKRAAIWLQIRVVCGRRWPGQSLQLERQVTSRPAPQMPAWESDRSELAEVGWRSGNE